MNDTEQPIPIVQRCQIMSIMLMLVLVMKAVKSLDLAADMSPEALAAQIMDRIIANPAATGVGGAA